MVRKNKILTNSSSEDQQCWCGFDGSRRKRCRTLHILAQAVVTSIGFGFLLCFGGTRTKSQTWFVNSFLIGHQRQNQYNIPSLSLSTSSSSQDEKSKEEEMDYGTIISNKEVYIGCFVPSSSTLEGTMKSGQMSSSLNFKSTPTTTREDETARRQIKIKRTSTKTADGGRSQSRISYHQDPSWNGSEEGTNNRKSSNVHGTRNYSSSRQKLKKNRQQLLFMAQAIQKEIESQPMISSSPFLEQQQKRSSSSFGDHSCNDNQITTTTDSSNVEEEEGDEEQVIIPNQYIHSNTQKICQFMYALAQATTSRDVIKVGKGFHSMNVTHLALTESFFVMERMIRSCSIVGLSNIATEAYFVLLQREDINHNTNTPTTTQQTSSLSTTATPLISTTLPSSMCYVALLQCLRKLGKITKMKQVLDGYSTRYNEIQSRLRTTGHNATTSNNDTDPLPLNVIALNVYVAALCEDVSTQFPYNQIYDTGATTISGSSSSSSTLTMNKATGQSSLNQTLMEERIYEAIHLIQPNVAKERYAGVEPDMYTFNTVLNAAASNLHHVWNQSVILDNIQEWMKIMANEQQQQAQSLTLSSSYEISSFDSASSSSVSKKTVETIVESFDIVTTNALLRGYVGSGDYVKAIELIDKRVLVLAAKKGSSSLSSPSINVRDNSNRVIEAFRGDRFTVDLCILPLLYYNRTSDLLIMIDLFAHSHQAHSITQTSSKWISKVFAAFLTRIAIGGRSPQVAGKVLKQMFLSSMSSLSKKQEVHLKKKKKGEIHIGNEGSTNTSGYPPPSTRHCNIVIEGYRKLQQQLGHPNQLSNNVNDVSSSKTTRTKTTMKSRVPELQEQNKRAAGHIWRSMIRFRIPPDKYTLTSLLGLQTTSNEMKDLCRYILVVSNNNSNQRTGRRRSFTNTPHHATSRTATSSTTVRPSGALCRSIMTELGRVGDASSVCSVFDWMYLCHLRMGKTLPRHKIETWNTLLSALASREGLESNPSQTLRNTLTEDLDTWLILPPPTPSTSRTAYSADADKTSPKTLTDNMLKRSPPFLSMSSLLEGSTRLEALQLVFDILKSQGQTKSIKLPENEPVPEPNSQSFCIMAAALARLSEMNFVSPSSVSSLVVIPSKDDGSNKASTTQSNAKQPLSSAMTQSDIQRRAQELFHLAVQMNIPADGRFVNAILRCYGSDIEGAIQAWKGGIGRTILRRARAIGARGDGSNNGKGSNSIEGTTTIANGSFSSTTSSSSGTTTVVTVPSQPILVRRTRADLQASYHGLITVCGRAGRPDLAIRLTYAMNKEGLEPNETTLNCYKSGKRQKEARMVHLSQGDDSITSIGPTWNTQEEKMKDRQEQSYPWGRKNLNEENKNVEDSETVSLPNKLFPGSKRIQNILSNALKNGVSNNVIIDSKNRTAQGASAAATLAIEDLESAISDAASTGVINDDSARIISKAQANEKSGEFTTSSNRTPQTVLKGALDQQLERILAVECSKFDVKDKRRIRDRRVKIIY